MQTPDQQKYERAKQRVKEEKGFYIHLTIYIIINTLILFVNTNFESQGFKNWLQWHLYVTPVLWGIGLLFHYIKAFDKNPFFSKKWEERKIKEILREEDDFFKDL
ncbi:2TM domain-containing protein [Aquimarina spongiae]|uniref:2TM domain-containing protein n=1 Tax=Aquimarina spongiae TaxID=570521 RepID=A0A1M6CR29_9FLAO|nr:2TM domain-containing protein [Aquimarina spongiae]SHI63188.1 2TM domain-containing protein [Aquimarina spongiae]